MTHFACDKYLYENKCLATADFLSLSREEKHEFKIRINACRVG